jgi:hypothetical protein
MSLYFTRSRFEDETNVFYTNSWGHCGDHWLAKVLNLHPEIFALNAYEGVRAKYIKTHDRGSRPDVLAYTAFLEDMGTDFGVIGDCHGYKAHEMGPVQKKYGERVPILNLVRHPHVWLEYFVRHRMNNMRMPWDYLDPVEFEWKIVKHDLFANKGLKPYTRDDKEIWMHYQGCYTLSGVTYDTPFNIRTCRIEDLTGSRGALAGAVDFLTRGRYSFDAALLDEAMRQSGRVFKGEETVSDPAAVYAGWPDWKREAFAALVGGETLEFFQDLGYDC